MQIAIEAVLPFPRGVVFPTYRDRIVDLLPYLPNVRRIEERSRVERGGVLEATHVWHGGGEIPAIARSVLSESMLSWTDHARWDEGEGVCAWRVETHAFRDAVTCAGTHAFRDEGTGTRIL